jgi:hypothetical protein
MDALPATGMTVWAWIYRTADTANSTIMSKRNSNGWHFLADNISSVPGRLRFLHIRATTNTDFIGSTGATDVVASNIWTFVAATMNDAATPKVKMYRGERDVVPAEISYTTTQAGPGALTSDATANLYVGNLQQVTTGPFQGAIARGGVIARVLTLAQLQELWVASLRSGSPQPHCNVANTALLFDHINTSNVTDLSGNGNNGTVTNAVNADHPLFRSPLSLTGVG